MSSTTRLNPEIQRNTPEIVVGKLRELLQLERLDRLVVVCWIRDDDGVPCEMMLGSDTLDRYDLLCGEQSLRVMADNVYRLKLEAGLAHLHGKH